MRSKLYQICYREIRFCLR
nr:unnamed protein product [Callosobruchus chinensis]